MQLVFVVAFLAFFGADVTYKIRHQESDAPATPIDGGPTSKCPKEFFCPNVPSGPDNGYPQ